MRAGSLRRRRRLLVATATSLALLTLVPAAGAGHAGGVQLGHTHVTTELTGFLGHSNMPLLYAANDWGNGVAGVSRGFGVGVYGAFERTAGTQAGVRGDTLSSSPNAIGVLGQVTANPAGGSSAGVRGINSGTTGNGIGVYGSQAGSGWGVFGTTPSGRGVYGFSGSGTGVTGQSSSGKAGEFFGQLHATGDVTKAYAVGNESRIAPIAYATVSSTGTVHSGTPNVSATWEAASTRYRITISGHSYFSNLYTTVVTVVAAGAPFIATVSNEGGDLLVRVWNLSGSSVQGTFQFVTYRQ
jgi:hypothetical protein